MSIASTLGYLLWHGLRNRVRMRIRRAKNPRYLLGMVAGGAYMAWFWLRPLVQLSKGSGTSGAGEAIAAIGSAVAVAFILLQSLYWWVFGGNRLTLAFTPAEVSFLFTAPISRRSLIAYKLLRSQLSALFSVVLGVLLLRRGNPLLPLPLRAIGLWLFFTIPGLHSMGAALVRASWVEHGMLGVRQQRLAVGVVSAVFVALAIGIVGAIAPLRAAVDGGFAAVGVTLGTVLTTGTLGIVLWPVRAAVAPMFAPTAAAWAHALPGALLLLVVHTVWVFRSDAAFEEAAVAASAARVARIEAYKARRAGTAVPKKGSGASGSIRLAARGHPAVAIVWKNIIAFRRRSGFGTIIFLAVIPILCGGISAWMGTPISAGVAGSALLVAATFSFFGPALMRSDLRQDMLNIVALKTLPLSGRVIVTAEVMSVVVPVAVVQFILIVYAAGAALIDPGLGVSRAQVAIVLAIGLPAIIALEGSLVTIMNAAPVLFPAWTRLGMTADAGMEGLGGRMVAMGIMLMLLILMLIVPGAIAGGLLYFGREHVVPALSLALALGGGTLALELFGALGILGRALDRTEPSEIA